MGHQDCLTELKNSQWKSRLLGSTWHSSQTSCETPVEAVLKPRFISVSAPLRVSYLQYPLVYKQRREILWFLVSIAKVRNVLRIKGG